MGTQAVPCHGAVRNMGLLDFKSTHGIVVASGEQLGKMMALQMLITALNTRPSTVSLSVVTVGNFLWRTRVDGMGRKRGVSLL